MTQPRGKESRTGASFSAAGSGECPNENDLADLVAGTLTPARADLVRAHVLACSLCQDLVGDAATPPARELRAPLRGELVGRYLVLGVLGSGAMGMVYEAFDPELDRKVALKFVRVEATTRTDGAELRARLRREAQVMAKVAHPNVITVHDVGSFDASGQDQLYVAMERVDGGTLTAWLASTPRKLDEILAMFTQAGRGLAAAHAAGLVHRDFKPDNVLVGIDGRPRVTDFGLARAPERGDAPVPLTDAQLAATYDDGDLTRTGTVLGTPAYMAPEQLAGAPSDARADSYAFCVALFEAIVGSRPFSAKTLAELRASIAAGALRIPRGRLPHHLESVLRKGLALEPEARWQTIDALLAALQRRSRTPYLAAAAVTVAALATGGAVIGTSHSATAAPCADGASTWGATWSASDRAAVHARFLATTVPFAADAFTAVDQLLGTRKRDWLAMSQQACEATVVHHTQSAQLLDRRTSCLAQRLRETTTLVGLFAQADAELVEGAADAAKQLSSLDDCANAAVLGTAPELSLVDRGRARTAADLVADARALRIAGYYAKGLTAARQAEALATTIPDPGLHAMALVAVGLLTEEQLNYADAEAAFHRAVRDALSVHDDTDAADAWLELAGLVGYRFARLDEAYVWMSYAEVAMRKLDDPKRRSKYFFKKALIEWSLESKLVEANDDWAKHLALDAGLPETSTKFADHFGPALVDEGRYDLAERVYADAVQKLTTEKGPHHPELLEEIENQAETLQFLGRAAEAIPMYRDVIARFPDRVDGYTHHRLADALRRTGDVTGAYTEDQLSLQMQADYPVDAADNAQPLTGLGLDLILLGKPQAAIAPLEHAAKIRALGKLPTGTADTNFVLARALWLANPPGSPERARAMTLATTARDAYAAAGTQYGSRWFTSDAQAITTWLADPDTWEP